MKPPDERSIVLIAKEICQLETHHILALPKDRPYVTPDIFVNVRSSYF